MTDYTVKSLGICGVSFDTENRHVVRLHYRHEATAKDPERLIAMLNAGQRALGNGSPSPPHTDANDTER